MFNFSNPLVLDENGKKVNASIAVMQSGATYNFTITMHEAAKVSELVIFSGNHNWNSSAEFYGDGYQKLSQYGGTISKVKNIAFFEDGSHYKMPQTKGYHTAYNYITVKDKNETILIGATSCHRFRTELRINGKELVIAQCLENLSFNKDDCINCEEMTILCGDTNTNLKKFSALIELNHPAKKVEKIPTGWCSWYCIGPHISEDDIFENLRAIKEKTPELEYIQIDDGFQPFMGDWLEISNKFKRPMKEICADIKKAGFKPAIWLAPFIASPKSRLFREHPDYFVKDDNGQPLVSKKVTFPGWRDGPWLFLDTTNPDAQTFIYDTVKEIYEQWGVDYFKLDANVWGALPFGNRYDPQATCIESYRKGMDAIWDATQNNAFILGCNAPMWPSLGAVSGMRITGDICRHTSYIMKMSKECFHRNWMNNVLWVNDPDCVIMKSAVNHVMDAGGKRHFGLKSKKMYRLNAAYIKASGGMVLSGDYISRYSDADVQRLKRLIHGDHTAATFDDLYEIGTISNGDETEYCIFNRYKWYKKYEIAVPNGYIVRDMYQGTELKATKNCVQIRLSKNDAAWIMVEPQKE